MTGIPAPTTAATLGGTGVMGPVYLAAGLEAAFRRIHEGPMAGLPFLNPRLAVEAVGFRPWERACLEVLVTPWSMNLMLVRVEGGQWADHRPGEQGLVRFPSGPHEFILGEEAGVGPYRMCSLFSPVLEFADRPTAVAAARAALDLLMMPPAVMEDVPVAAAACTVDVSSPPSGRCPGAASWGAGAHDSTRSPVGIEGQLTITLRTAHGRVAAVDIQSSRPLRAPRVFVGRSPAAVLEALPMIYSLCATAQAAAARQALGAALGRPPDAAARAGRLLVDVETVREHTLGILLGWSEYLEEGPDPAAATMMGLLPAVREAVFAGGRAFALDAEVAVDGDALAMALGQMKAVLEGRVFGLPLDIWYGLATPAELAKWAGQGTTVAARVVAAALAEEPAEGPADTAPDAAAGPVALLPDLDDATLGARLRPADADAFIARPLWQGAPRETSSLSRRRAHPLVAGLLQDHGDGLVTRLAARLVELAALARGLEDALPRLADAPAAAVEDGRDTGEGMGQVEAARGRLVHRVELAAGTVTRYQVLAPTEWNFHPQGAAVRALARLVFTDAEDLRRRAALAIRALDPCVGFQLVVTP